MKQQANIMLRFSSLGDIVLCSALAQKLCSEEKQALNYFVTNIEFKSFVQKSFPCQTLKVLSVRKKLFSYFFSGFKIAYKLIKKYPDLKNIYIYDLHQVGKSRAWIRGFRLLSFFISRLQVTLLKSEKQGLKRHLSILKKKDLLGKRFIYLEHVKCAPGTNNYHPQLDFVKGQQSLVKKILLAPDSAKWKKKWLTSYWDELFQMIHKKFPSAEITLVGGKKCIPQDLVDEMQFLAKSNFKNLLGKTKLEHLAQIASEHDVTVCGNSAWLHISEAVNTPVISLAGPIVPGFGFSPWRHKSTELSVNLNCRPCSKHGGGLCPKVGDDFHACMKQILPKDVLTKIEETI